MNKAWDKTKMLIWPHIKVKQIAEVTAATSVCFFFFSFNIRLFGYFGS